VLLLLLRGHLPDPVEQLIWLHYSSLCLYDRVYSLAF
jgi:hypothetical protein